MQGIVIPNASTKLQRAAQSGNVAAVDRLLATGRPSATDKGMALFIASNVGSSDVVASLLRAGAPTDTRMNLSEEVRKRVPDTALGAAAEFGYTRIVELLLAAGADVSAADDVGGTALHNAALAGHSDIIRLLLAAGADVNHQDMHQQSALAHAAFTLQAEAVKALLDAGADVKATNDKEYTALHEAIESHDSIVTEGRQAAVVRLLLAAGSPLDARDERGWTPLHRACRGLHNGTCHAKVVRLLVEAGAPINALDQYEQTPLLIAAKNCHLEAVKVLVDAGASVEAADDYGNTPLHVAAMQKDGAAVVRALLAAGASVKAEVMGCDYLTPLHLAAQEGAVEPAKELIRAGAAVGAPVQATDGGSTSEPSVKPPSLAIADPLHWAAKKGHTDMCRLLLAAGADVNAVGLDGRRPLHCAAGHLDTALLLIQMGAGTDPKLFSDQRGRSPLEAAAAGNAQHLRALKAEAKAQRCCAQCGEAAEKLLRCARCRIARYCGPDCQKEHWKQGHKAVCQRLKVVIDVPGMAGNMFSVVEFSEKPR